MFTTTSRSLIIVIIRQLSTFQSGYLCSCDLITGGVINYSVLGGLLDLTPAITQPYTTRFVGGRDKA